MNSSVDLNRKEDVIELGPWIEQQQHGRRRPALDIIISFFKCQTGEEKKKSPGAFPLAKTRRIVAKPPQPLASQESQKGKRRRERILEMFFLLGSRN